MNLQNVFCDVIRLDKKVESGFSLKNSLIFYLYRQNKIIKDILKFLHRILNIIVYKIRICVCVYTFFYI